MRLEHYLDKTLEYLEALLGTALVFGSLYLTLLVWG